MLIASSAPIELLVKLAASGTFVGVLLAYSRMGVKLPGWDIYVYTYWANSTISPTLRPDTNVIVVAFVSL